MTNDLDQILISYKQPDFGKKLEKLCISTLETTWFRDDDSKRDKVRDIVEDISKRRDKAVAEYTEKFDGVKLSPDQFRVSKQDLEKARNEIDKNLLKSIHQSIENVRKYQTEIFIGNFKHPGIKYLSLIHI